MSLKIIFAGTPQFAVPTLQALIDSSHDVVAVYTQPDRPAGRGRHLKAPPVKALAIENNIIVRQPKTLRDEFALKQLQELNADVIVVVAYGLILPEAVLSIPSLGCVNVHPSLLPKWRGAAPIQRSIEAGDLLSGVTIMQMDKGMDTGPILKQVTHKLAGDEASADMHDFYSEMGAKLLLETLSSLEKNELTPIIQDNSQATYANKIDKQDAVINWNLSASVIANKVRAFNPWPVAQTTFDEQILRIWQASAIQTKSTASPGTLVDMDHKAFYIATGDGALKVTSVQLPGKKQMSAADFMRGYENALKPNDTVFG